VRKEALVWNTRLRMEKGMGVVGNGVGLLNGQTTKGDSIASEEGGLYIAPQQRLRRGDHIAKWTWVMSRYMDCHGGHWD
jgi:hypothetical protein